MNTTRRSFLGRAAAAAAAAGCAGVEEEKDAGANADGNAGWIETAPEDLEPGIDPITPNASFYHVTALGQQDVDRESWTLVIQSLSGDTVELTADELEALGGEEVERTLMCIGSHSGVSTGNAKWRGIRVAALLDAVGITRDSEWVWVESVEGFATCLPATDLDAGMMVVWEMNGEPLPADHGGPARILTPGRYGMKQPKWLKRIAFISAYEDGFWEAFGWSAQAVNRLQSWFLAPDADVGPAAGELVTLKGCAFAGLTGVSKVEVSTDAVEWREAELTYAGGPDVWTLWRIGWTAPAAGTYTFFVRATDATGKVQENLESNDTALDGLETFDALTLTVA